MINSRGTKIKILSSVQSIERYKSIGFVIKGKDLAINGLVISSKSVQICFVTGETSSITAIEAEYKLIIDNIASDLKSGKIHSNVEYDCREFSKKYLKKLNELVANAPRLGKIIDENTQPDQSTQTEIAFNLTALAATVSSTTVAAIGALLNITTKQIEAQSENNATLISSLNPNPENEIHTTAIFVPILALVVIGLAAVIGCAWNRRRNSGQYDFIEAAAKESLEKGSVGDNELSSTKSYERNSDEYDIDERSLIESSSGSPISKISSLLSVSIDQLPTR